jgi:hypothetical protein
MKWRRTLRAIDKLFMMLDKTMTGVDRPRPRETAMATEELASFIGSVLTSNGGYSVMSAPGRIEIQTRDVMNGTWNRWHPKLSPEEAKRLVVVLQRAIKRSGGEP